jgi:hypothetical protein
MKTIKALLILLTISMYSCDNNDDAQTDLVNPTDGFTHNGTFYETSNAYFEIDEDDDDHNANIGNNGFPDEYNFFFSNGRMLDNETHVNGVSDDYLFSLDTTNWVFFNLRAEDNPSLVSAGPMAGSTYIGGSSDTVIIENGLINVLSPSYFNNNIEFGQGDEDEGVVNETEVAGTTITINQINLDANDPAGSTIDADYTFINENGDVITGHYEGTFGVFLD